MSFLNGDLGAPRTAHIAFKDLRIARSDVLDNVAKLFYLVYKYVLVPNGVLQVKYLFKVPRSL